MRLEVGGAQITESMVEVLETLQTQPKVTEAYLQALDEVTRSVILDISGLDDESDIRTLARLRALQMIRRDIVTFAASPEIDAPENDIPVAQL